MPGQAASEPSVTQSMASSLMKGFDKLTGAITPKPTVTAAPDAVSLQSKGKPGPELYVRVAQLHQRADRPAEAAQNYRKALETRPDYMGALLGYARLKDRTGDVKGAHALYQQAARAHPKEAAAFNNLGLFQARHRMLDEAASSLTQAIRLQPKVVKYRNNIATLLVERGLYKEAFMHLQVVHGEAVAYYNLGFLLEKKGQIHAATLHYAVAARKNPAMVEPSQALARLQSVATRTQPPMRQGSPLRPPVPPSQQVTMPPSRSTAMPPTRQLTMPPSRSTAVPPWQSTPLPPAPQRPGLGVRQLPPAPSEQEQINRRPSRPSAPSYPQRLPPTSTGSSGNPAAAPLPSGSYRPPAIGSAPLPPLLGR